MALTYARNDTFKFLRGHASKLRAALLAGLLVALSSGAGESNVRLSRGELQGATVAGCSQQLVTVTLNVGTASWTVPTGVTTLARVAAIGGGGGTSNGGNNTGAGAGAYSEIDNLAVTPGANLGLSIGAAGIGGASSTSGNFGTPGGDTSVNYGGSQILLAKGGSVGFGSSAPGGAASAGVGTIKFSGGDGGAGSSSYVGAGGGGGAGGPNGNGITGTAASSTSNAGGAGGAGDNGSGGTGGSPGPGNGTSGGTGGNGSEFSGGGSGGGGGGGSFSTVADAGGNGGSYGAGGGAAAYPNTTTFPAGGNGSPGAVFVVYSTCGSLPPPPPPVASFFAATNGSDSNPGTLAAPFLTLGQCQSAMRNSTTIKTCTLRAGTYTIGSTLSVTSSDNGETWQYYSADGVNSAIVNGGGTTATAVSFASGLNGFTWNGIAITGFTTFGIEGPATNVTIENSDIGNGGLVGSSGVGSSSAISADGPNIIVSHNYVHNWQSAGITVYAYNAGDSVNGTVVDSNVVLNTCTALGDCGAIYTNMYGTGTAGGSVTISNNFVRDYGSSSLTADMVGIYLDDKSSNVTVHGNIIGPAIAGAVSSTNANNTAATFNNSDGVTGNGYNTWSGNILDVGLTSSGSYTGVAYLFGQSNIFENNLVLFGFTGTYNATSGGSTGFAYQNTSGSITIKDNGYTNCAGGSVFSNGNPTRDSLPTTISQTNLQMSGDTYTLASGSAAFSAPVNFPGITGGWGPPGFTIPASTNHSCAAEAVDSQEAGGAGHESATSPLAWSFTNTSGSLLIVSVAVTANAGTGPTVSAVTYGGVLMTQLAVEPYDLVSGANIDVVYLFYLFNPPTGANTVSVTWSPGSGASAPDSIGAAISFDRVGSLATPAGANYNGTASTPATVNVTGTLNGDIVVSAAMAGSAFSGAVSPTVQSAGDNVSGGTAGDNLILGYQRTTGGTATAAYAISAADYWGALAVELLPP